MTLGVCRRLARVGCRSTFAVMLCAATFPVLRADAATSRVNQDAERLLDLNALMLASRAESMRDAVRIRNAYGSYVDRLLLPDRAALQLALARDIVRPLPDDGTRFNLRPRLLGPHPIGEKDMAFQSLYVAGRASTLGCLFHVAAAVRTTPLEVTSLVRHLAYQQALQRTNRNAQAIVPLHAAGLAFDISVLHAPLDAATEIRDALRHLRDAGYLFFIAETQQFVFHVVPAPARLDFYAHLFHALTSLPDPPGGASLAPLPVVSTSGAITSGGVLMPHRAEESGHGRAIWPAVILAGTCAMLGGWRRSGNWSCTRRIRVVEAKERFTP